MKMKACSKNQKPLALLALGAVDEQEAKVLRAHLRTCNGCRAYWHEISNVAERVSVSDRGAELECSEGFHRRVAARIKAEQPHAKPDGAWVLFRTALTNWRVALPVLGATCVIAALMIGAHNHGTSPTTPSRYPNAEVSNETNLAPSLVNYQLAASRSFEQLDRLLTTQANQPHRSWPLYTAGSGMMTGAE